MTTSPILRLVTLIALLLGAAATTNGVLMLVNPEAWYWTVPGVIARGAFNQHFLRDIGIIYVLIGGAFVYGAVYTTHRFVLWLLPSAWLLSHALFHFWEVLVGICGIQSLQQDFAGVTLPAILALVITFWRHTPAVKEEEVSIKP